MPGVLGATFHRGTRWRNLAVWHPGKTKWEKISVDRVSLVDCGEGCKKAAAW